MERLDGADRYHLHTDLPKEITEQKYCQRCYEPELEAEKRREESMKQGAQRKGEFARAGEMKAFFGQKLREKIGGEDDVVIVLPRRGQPSKDPNPMWRHLLTDECRAPSLASFFAEE